MPPQYPETYTRKNGRNDVDAFRVALIRSFRFMFIVCIAPQQANAAVPIVRAGLPLPLLSPKSQSAKIQGKVNETFPLTPEEELSRIRPQSTKSTFMAYRRTPLGGSRAPWREPEAKLLRVPLSWCRHEGRMEVSQCLADGERRFLALSSPCGLLYMNPQAICLSYPLGDV